MEPKYSIFTKIRLWIFCKWLSYMLRNEDENVCCCGEDMRSGGYPGCPVPCRSQKDYTFVMSVNAYKRRIGVAL